MKNQFLSRLALIADKIRKKNNHDAARRWMNLYHNINSLSVAEYARYKNNRNFFDQINIILADQDFSDMDLENGYWCKEFEEGNMIFLIEYHEDELTTGANFLNEETSEETQYDLSEDENGIIKDWLDGYLKEYRSEASNWTGDPWKDNGVSKRDYYGI